MKSVKIVLSMAESVKHFVNIVSKYPYDIDLRSDRFLIDAKSLLGIFSLDLSKPIVLEIHSEKCDDLLAELVPYMAKEPRNNDICRPKWRLFSYRKKRLDCHKRRMDLPYEKAREMKCTPKVRQTNGGAFLWQRKDKHSKSIAQSSSYVLYWTCVNMD